jgi:hypothetical protein
MIRRVFQRATFACVLWLVAPAALAQGILKPIDGILRPVQGILNPVVEGDTLRADIQVGAFSANLAIRFENVVGLTPSNLGLSARLVNPLSLRSRLDTGISLPLAFPLALRIEPPASSGLSFSGVVSVELYTHDLQYVVGSPLRLYSAPVGGRFTDITSTLGSGSIRSGGTKPDFSEFLIVVDLRPPGTVIASKYAQLTTLLSRHADSIDSELLAELNGLKNASEQSWRSRQTVAAITYLEAFADRVKAHSGTDIPDVWRSSRDVTNVAGSLRAAAATLRFSLTLASNAP